MRGNDACFAFLELRLLLVAWNGRRNYRRRSCCGVDAFEFAQSHSDIIFKAVRPSLGKTGLQGVFAHFGDVEIIFEIDENALHSAAIERSRSRRSARILMTLGC